MTPLQAGIDDGATLLTGGKRPAVCPRGFYLEPTVFINVRPHMRIWKEEIFGPVLSGQRVQGSMLRPASHTCIINPVAVGVVFWLEISLRRRPCSCRLLDLIHLALPTDVSRTISQHAIASPPLL